MTRTKSTYLTLLAILLSPLAANADLLRLDAISASADIGDFYIVFDDGGDGLLEWSEIVEFSGYSVDFLDLLLDTVVGVPTIAGISTFSFDPTFDIGVNDWFFTIAGDTIPVSCSGGDPFVCWNDYSISPVTVPEPSTLALLVIGLLGLTAARRRKA